MIFDKFCGIVERDRSDFFDNFPNLMEDLKYRVKLFHINDYARNVVNPNWHLDYQNHYNHFFLPFKKVAIEDKLLLTLLFDLEDNQEGLHSYRKAIVFDKKSKCIFTAEFRLHNDDSTFKTILSQQRDSKFAVVDKKDIKETKIRIRNRKIIKIGLRNISIAIKEIAILNTPNVFILEQRPLQNRIVPLRIPRSHQRSKFIFLTPNKIRKRYFGDENHYGNNGSKAPHERRRHVRRYPNDPERFPNAHGKTVIIPATWIGTQERQIGKKIYKVRLDL